MDNPEAAYSVQSKVRHALIMQDENGEIISFTAIEKTTQQRPNDSLTDATLQAMLTDEKESVVDVAANLQRHRETGVIAGAIVGGTVAVSYLATHRDIEKVPESVIAGVLPFAFAYGLFGELIGQIGKFANKRYNRVIHKRIGLLEGFIARRNNSSAQVQE